MQQIDPCKLYELGAKLHGLFETGGQLYAADLFLPLTDAQKILDALIKGEMIALTVAKPDATRLLTQISSLFDKHFIDPSSKQMRQPSSEDLVEANDIKLIRTCLEKFERALAAEFSRHSAWMASKRGIYETDDLIANAVRAVPEPLRDHVPDSGKEEMNEAGRALAFGLGSAAAMHMLRATELMVHRYHEVFAGGPIANKSERNLATYLRKLNALAEEDHDGRNRPDPRVVQLLVLIKDRYRNPLLQPETNFTVDDATVLLGLCTSAIAQMADQIRVRKTQQDHRAALRTPTTAPEGQTQDSRPDTTIAPKESDAAQELPPGLRRGGDEDTEDEDEEIYDFRLSRAG